MSDQDDFFTPEEVDRQIEQIGQLKKGERADAEVLAYLRTVYGIEAQQEQAMLDRIWKRIADATPPLVEQIPRNVQQNYEKKEGRTMQHQPTLLSNQSLNKPRIPLLQRLGLLAAIICMVALVGSAAVLFYSMHQNAGGPASGGPKSNPIVKTPKPTNSLVAFKVTSVDMSVQPGSIAGLACGSNLTVTYKAIIHVTPHGPGGIVQFSYTVNNGRSQTPASVTFAPGETSKAYTFTWSGALPVDHTYPAQGGINITSPNQLISPLVAPTGTCVSPSAFSVTGVDMAVNPTSIQGLACGSSLVVTYTATIHVAANSPGGTVQFSYTINNGRSQTPASVTFAPGETSKTYTFTWSGSLPVDHTYPGPGGINVTSPNQLVSPLVGPTGACQ